MANSALSVFSNTSNPGITASDAQKYFAVGDVSQYGAKPGYGFGDGITGRGAQKDWEYRQNIANMQYEQQNLISARKWDEYMNSHKYQMAVKDLKDAGLNPWLAVQNGLGIGSNTQTATTGSYHSTTKSQTANSAQMIKGAGELGMKLFTSAIKIAMLAMIL